MIMNINYQLIKLLWILKILQLYNYKYYLIAMQSLKEIYVQTDTSRFPVIIIMEITIHRSVVNERGVSQWLVGVAPSDGVISLICLIKYCFSSLNCSSSTEKRRYYVLYIYTCSTYIYIHT